MLSSRVRRATVPLLFVVMATWATACGSSPADEVSSGAGTEASTTSAPSGQVTTTVPATTTSTVATGSDDSPIDGLTASQLQAALAVPPSASVRALGGPTAEVVQAPGGPRLWRVRIPGEFPVRAARVEILVGGAVIGEGIVAGDLSSLSTVTTDTAPLQSGAAVSYRWEGGTPIAAGPLEVLR